MSREQTAHLQASMFCADQPTQSPHPSTSSDGGPSLSGPQAHLITTPGPGDWGSQSPEPGLPWWFSWDTIRLQCRRPGFEPWFGKIPWKRAWQPTPVSWPGEAQGRSSPRGRRESDVTEQPAPFLSSPFPEPPHGLLV